MKTTERILECALGLFNQQGEPNVTPVQIASALGISPGNLYYHYHGKEPIVQALFERFRADTAPLLHPPGGVRLATEELWLFLHLLAECMAGYCFLFQDLSNLAGRMPKLARGLRQWLATLRQALGRVLGALHAGGTLSASGQARAALEEQLLFTLVFSPDYQRVFGQPPDPGRAVHQMMLLLAPHLAAPARQEVETLALSYTR